MSNAALSAPVAALDAASFNAFVASQSEPVLIDFWAPWCGPCRALAPTLDQLAQNLAGQVQVRKVNVDEAQALAAQFNVRSIPTLILFKNGHAHSQQIGQQSEQQLSAWIRSAL